jgi:hypothetical protein
MDSFSVGDEVICINDTRPDKHQDYIIPNWPVKDNIYTIRAFQDNEGIVVGILLEEIENPEVPIQLIHRVQEPAFATWRFAKHRSAYMIEEESEEVEEEIFQELVAPERYT